MDFDLRAHTHLLAVAGSRAHGLHTEDSDLDLKGVAIPPKSWLLGFTRSFEHCDDADEMRTFLVDLPQPERHIAMRTDVEGTVYDLRKFLSLATAANPNALELLFCRDEELRRVTPVGEHLRETRDAFLSARCVQTFAGYASQQLGRIRLHYRWHHDGPEQPPTRADFALPDVALIPRDQRQAAEAAVRKQLATWELDLPGLEPSERERVQARLVGTLAELGLASEDDRWAAAARWVGLGDDLIDAMRRERAYQAARGEWRRYQAWKQNRNPARAALEARFGYDTKHGAHLVRLLRMGLEIAQEGRCIVWRGDRDAEELRAIRDGAWSYDALVAWADARTAELHSLTELAVPTEPDRDAIDALCVAWIEQAWSTPARPA